MGCSLSYNDKKNQVVAKWSVKVLVDSTMQLKMFLDAPRLLGLPLVLTSRAVARERALQTK